MRQAIFGGFIGAVIVLGAFAAFPREGDGTAASQPTQVIQSTTPSQVDLPPTPTVVLRFPPSDSPYNPGYVPGYVSPWNKHDDCESPYQVSCP